MDSIKIKNFRSLKNTGDIDLKPITLLVGKNSAGKSTFLRTFPLFKQSVEERTKAPILLYSRSGVDFGSFNDVKSIFAKDEEFLEFEFGLSNINLNNSLYINNTTMLIDKLKVCMKINSSSDDTPYLKIIKLNFLNNKVLIHLNEKENSVEKIIINNEILNFDNKLTYFSRGLIVDRLMFRGTTNREDLEDYSEEILLNLINKKVRKGTSRENLKDILRRIVIISSKEDFLKQIKMIKRPITWVNKVKSIDLESSYFKKLYQYMILYHIERILQKTNITLRDTFHRVKYIAPIRATAERYYRIQDLSVNEVDPHGQNLPMFLGSLSSGMMKKFQFWTEENFNFKVKIKKIEGHYSIKILYKNNFEVNISDIGFGYSQILPIITQIWYSTEERGSIIGMTRRNTPTIIVIEQPELHLHPEFQAKFADVIVKVIHNLKNKNIKLIIETHSQTIINRIGLNISKEKISGEKINVIIFDKEDEGKATKIKSANYDKDGLLENWPIGFFKPSSL